MPFRVAIILKITKTEQVHRNQRIQCWLIKELVDVGVGLIWCCFFWMFLGINKVRWCVLIQNVEEVSKGADNDEYQHRKDTNIVNSCGDEVDEVSWHLEEAHPVKDLDPEAERNDTSDSPITFLSNEKRVLIHTHHDNDDVPNVEHQCCKIDAVPVIFEVVTTQLNGLGKFDSGEEDPEVDG